MAQVTLAMLCGVCLKDQCVFACLGFQDCLFALPTSSRASPECLPIHHVKRRESPSHDHYRLSRRREDHPRCVPPVRDREFGTHSAPHLTILSDPRTLPPFPFFAVNHILTAKHGKRIAIIENEFGEVGIDDGLVIHAEEEIFEMNNGCICCTVRQDLVRILGKLLRRKDKFDHIIIETTGLADPAPVAQTFFVDEELKEQLYLDAIVTICDARHLSVHLDERKPEGVENESVEQVAFADRILLNKMDLVKDDDEKVAVIAKIREINTRATIIETTHAVLNIDDVLGVKAFDLTTVMAMDAEFLDVDGTHEHDSSVTSVGFEIEDGLDLEKLNKWIPALLREKGVNIFRSKGILNIAGSDDLYVFQGVHMMMEMTSSADSAVPGWNNEETRKSRVIFIGRDLDRTELERGFKQCVAK